MTSTTEWIALLHWIAHVKYLKNRRHFCRLFLLVPSHKLCQFIFRHLFTDCKHYIITTMTIDSILLICDLIFTIFFNIHFAIMRQTSIETELIAHIVTDVKNNYFPSAQCSKHFQSHFAKPRMQ